MCKWVTNQGGSCSPLQDRNSMRNTLSLVTMKNGSFQEKLSKCCSPNPKKMMTSIVFVKIQNCLQFALPSHLPVPSPCQCFPSLASPPPVPSSFSLPSRLSHSGFWVFLPARVWLMKIIAIWSMLFQTKVTSLICWVSWRKHSLFDLKMLKSWVILVLVLTICGESFVSK